MDVSGANDKGFDVRHAFEVMIWTAEWEMGLTSSSSRNQTRCNADITEKAVNADEDVDVSDRQWLYQRTQVYWQGRDEFHLNFTRADQMPRPPQPPPPPTPKPTDGIFDRVR